MIRGKKLFKKIGSQFHWTKIFLFVFCIHLLPVQPVEASQDRVDRLTRDISSTKSQISSKERRVKSLERRLETLRNKRAPSGSRAADRYYSQITSVQNGIKETNKSLSGLKSRLKSKQKEKSLLVKKIETEETIRTAHEEQERERRESYEEQRDDVREANKKQRVMNYLTAAANTAVGGVLMYQGYVFAGQCGWLNFSACLYAAAAFSSGALSFAQAAENLDKNHKMKKIDKYFTNPHGGIGANDADVACSGSSEACKILKGPFGNPNYFSQGKFTPAGLVNLNKKFCPKKISNCLKLDSNGELQANKQAFPGADKFPKGKIPQDKLAVKRALDDAKKKHPKLFSDLDAKIAEMQEDLKDDSSTPAIGKFKAGKHLAGNKANSKKRVSRSSSEIDPVDQHLMNLLAQLQGGKKLNKEAASKSITVGKDRVGVAQDNIFLMVHRRYQERRVEQEFIESLQKRQLSNTRI